MRQKRKIGWLLVAVLGVAVAYHYIKPLKIFSQPEIDTINLPAPAHSELMAQSTHNLRCFEHAALAPIRDKTRFRLVDWNIHKGEDAGWQQKLSHYAKHADFLLLQEATQNNHLEQLLPREKSWHGIHAGTFSYHNDMSGVMLLATYLPQRYCIASEQEPWIRIPKIAQAAHFPLPDNRTLLVINVHLVNFEWNPKNYEQQLKAMFDIINQHDGPIILAGDFNSWRARRMRLLQRLVAQYGMQAVKFNPDFRKHFMHNVLDHIFVRDIKVINAWTEQTDASDHNPLVMDFSLE
ncbi:endonuclease/exonuclease/phosphatase family protein [Pasteurellaceae bacterium HPA106]|uniref:endonuclease/exonuclease/phosphatase family protein n=1 Tax=Spirabiliibacterium pneumoniae TaxID=221400 RepID=UPI001AADD70F|nr:endonuclease/exonuclease/phosphatase family protein [Spirabiliibacterium pneumoniae]MBE2896127.1 endonuclease/exonuclease/phosphatase family protein [Spirabiliibacterium pneumoniae]